MANGTITRKRARGTQFLPPSVRQGLARGLLLITGLSLIALAAASFVACITYDSRDPSWNHAIEGPARNFLGELGAIAADFLLQSLGLAAFLLLLTMFGWGWRLLRDRRPPRWWLLKLALIPPSLLLSAAALAAVAEPQWGYITQLGGALGETVYRWLTDTSGLDYRAVITGSAVLGGLGFLLTVAITRDEWRAVGRGLRWLFTAALGALGRAAASTPSAPAPGRPAPSRPAKRVAEEKPARREPSVARPEPAPDLVEAKPRPKPGKAQKQAGQRRLDFGPSGGYEFPPLDLLSLPKGSGQHAGPNRDALEKNARLLESVLEDFGVRGEIVKVRPGPVVTRYELDPAPGTKTSRVVGLADDIARSMSAISVRVAVVPGAHTIGIELPNAQREVVYLRELLGAQSFDRFKGKLPLILGKDISGAPMIVDLAKMPHLLIAGTTGSGKSVSINVLILSLLYRLTPETCRLVMIDPKMLELSVYEDIPHLLSPVVTDPKKAVVALKWTVREMENRYRNMSRLGVRNIDGYNERIATARRNGEVLTRRVQTGFDPDTGQPITEEQPFDLEPLPHIVVVVDEMADLMLVAGKEIESAVQRLSQMARAAGIHLIMATQRPSVDVITGTIKANFPTRISFHVTSRIDSRTILGDMGAEQLLGHGDMLFLAQGGRITRVHGPLVTDQEVEEVVNHLKQQGQPSYIEAITEDEEAGFEGVAGGGDSGDELYDRAVAVVCQHRKASTSFVQRHLQIGYNRAARIIEKMEAEGVVSPANHVGKREVLVQGPDG